jgi:hypothetical protein
MMDAQTDLLAATDQSEASGVSWAAVIAGAIATSALTLMLLAFGAGMGFSAVSPWSGSGISSTTFNLSAGIYLIVVAMLSSTIGGYLAGRLRTRWTGVHTHEVYFRDTAHGFLAWAFATVLCAALLGAAMSHLVGGTAAGLGQAAGSAAAGSSLDPYVDRLFRADPAASQAGNDSVAARREINGLLAASLRNGGDLSSADRAYAAQVVAAHTGLSQADAEKRVSDVVTQAKTAADDARKAAAKLSLWLTASLLIGAFAASLAATEGGMLRDQAWTRGREQTFRTAP